MSKDYDAIVIGAGIIGCCTGFELTKRGFRTLNIDKNPAAGRGSTGSSGTIIRFHYSTPTGVAMARESYFYWIDWGKYVGLPGAPELARYVNTGCLITKTSRNHYLKHVMAALDELHVAYEDLDAEGIRAKASFLDTRRFGPPVALDDPSFAEPTGGEVAGAIYLPESGYITDPALACRDVQAGCEALGGEFRFDAEVVQILERDGRAAGVRLKDGSHVRAPVVVNVGGPHSFVINRMAGVEERMNIKTRPFRVELCQVPAPAGIDYDTAGFVLSDGDTGCYSRPDTNNRILIGSEILPCDHVDWVEDPDDFDRTLSNQWMAQLRRNAQRVGGLRVEELADPGSWEGRVDLYDVTDDWIPVYDKSDLPGFYMAVGTSGNQFKNAPVVGMLMAEIVQNVEDGRDHDADPVRFHMKYTRKSFDAGFFSRMRSPNPDSSYSVIG